MKQVGGFGGKAVALAEGALYADDPGFYKKQLQAYAAATPESVKAITAEMADAPGLRADRRSRRARSL